jgi:membrane-bound lytic murein transglycosylase D
MLIKAGSALMVPRTTTTRQDVSAHLADNGQLALTPEIVTRRTTVRAGKRDTVRSIAQRYRVSADHVADWNDVKTSAAFKAGQQVVMFLPVRMGQGTSADRSASRKADKKANAPTPTRKGGKPAKKRR